MLKDLTRTPLTTAIALCLVCLCLPLPAEARVGDLLEEAKGTDFFRFFNLVQTGQSEIAPQRTVVTFRPGAGMFREMVTVTATLDPAGRILAMELTLPRSFVEHKEHAIFARDITKSFLRHAIPLTDERSIADLADEIEFPKELEGYEIMTTRPDPELPEQPTGGYLVYLGKRKSYEQEFDESTLRLENRGAGLDDAMLVRVETRSRVRVAPSRKRERP